MCVSFADIEKARTACSQRPLQDVYLNLQAVPVTCSMLVTGVQPELTQDSVQFYFENEQRTGGGPVEEVEMFYDEGLCLVHFNLAERKCIFFHPLPELPVRFIVICLNKHRI